MEIHSQRTIHTQRLYIYCIYFTFPPLTWKFTNERTIHTRQFAGFEPAISCVAATNTTNQAIWTLKANLSILLQLLIWILNNCIVLRYHPTSLNDWSIVFKLRSTIHSLVKCNVYVCMNIYVANTVKHKGRSTINL